MRGVGLGVRPFTFFENGVVGHVGFADPFDEKIAQVRVRFRRLKGSKLNKV